MTHAEGPEAALRSTNPTSGCIPPGCFNLHSSPVPFFSVKPRKLNR